MGKEKLIFDINRILVFYFYSTINGLFLVPSPDEILVLDFKLITDLAT